MVDLAVDHQTMKQAEDTVRRFLELTEQLEACRRSSMTDRELDYLQLRHELLGRKV